MAVLRLLSVHVGTAVPTRCCTGPGWERSKSPRQLSVTGRGCSLGPPRVSEKGQVGGRHSPARYRDHPAAAEVGARAGRKGRSFAMPNRDYFESNGNIFADLGLPKPDDLLAKAELTAKIDRK